MNLRGPTVITLYSILIVSNAAGQGSDLQRAAALIHASRTQEAESILRSLVERDPSMVEAHLVLGYLHLNRAALEAAEQAFQAALSRQPSYASARLGLGIVWLRKGWTRRASEQFEKILDDRKLGKRARVEWILSLFYEGREDDAFREARETVSRFPDLPEAHRILGFLYQVRGNQKAAVDEFTRAVELNPRDLTLYFALIGLYRSQKNWEKVVAWSENALELDRNHPLLYQELGKAYREFGRLKESTAAYEESQKCYEAETLYTASVSARRVGMRDEAERLLRRCLETNPGLSKAWVELGELLRGAKRLEEAREAFVAALETDSDNHRAHLGLAETLREQGRDPDAERAYRRALNRGIKDPDLSSGLAAVYWDQGRIQQAAAEMVRAVRAFPDTPELLIYLGHLQEISGRSSDALDSFAAALEIHPGSPHAWLGLIRARQRSGDLEGAEDACRACMKSVPETLECREALAFIRMEASDFAEASRQFQFLRDNGKTSRSILDGLAFSHIKQGDWVQASAALESSLKRFGEDGWTQKNLGYVWRARGNLGRAISHYRRACILAPRDAEAIHDLGFALYLARDFNEAITQLQLSLRLRPKWGLAHYNLALAHWNLHHYSLALEHARRAQSLGVREAAGAVRSLSQVWKNP